MAKLSVIIPSRDERFLEPTIRDIMRNRRSETEVIAVLDSDKWPENWKQLCAEFPDLHTIHNGASKGMRYAINAGVASAKSRGAKFILKSDGHCSFGEGFDTILQAECDKDWVVVPRRGRLDAENWCRTAEEKPDIDYHYLSFPDDPNDFGGPGLNGKVWFERALQRKDILIDEEMSSQGSAWFMHTDYFYQLELMDESSYGPFWNEFQEIGLKCWLSGGRVMVNKKTHYLHLHKGRKYGRGYRLPESALTTGRNYTMKWLHNEAWVKQTLPFKSLIERFWPVPSWPENWEELLYASKKPRSVGGESGDSGMGNAVDSEQSLKIHAARYGLNQGLYDSDDLDVTQHLQSLVANNALDIVVNNSTICPGQNPHRGKKKRLVVTYSYDGGDPVTVQREEKEWLIVGQARRGDELYKVKLEPVDDNETVRQLEARLKLDDDHPAALKSVQDAGYFAMSDKPVVQPFTVIVNRPTTATALNDHLIRKFRIPDRRLRGPMPIEIREFHRDDLAQLFAELGFRQGAEVGVAEGKYSEVLVKANPELTLVCVDPWHAYDGDAQNKTKEKHEFAFNETQRRLQGYKVQYMTKYSMDAVREVPEGFLDFVYIDGNHGYEYVMQDIIEWSKRVRSGGIVSGDDVYRLDPKWGAGPMEAVYHYTEAMKINPWFLINAHKSVDFFWVKP